MTSFPVGTEPPLAVPIVLAGVAGFVDACTFLGLFGFFVAQVTGSYVLAGARPVAGWPGAAVVLAVPVFFAGGVAATMAAVAGHGVARRPLAAALALETLLLVAFAATFAARPLFGALEMPVVVASMFGLAAMGVQSATVRLLMRGVGSTNVMTTTTSQIAIDATQLTWAWLRREGGVADTQRQAGDMPAPAMERPAAAARLPPRYAAGRDRVRAYRLSGTGGAGGRRGCACVVGGTKGEAGRIASGRWLPNSSLTGFRPLRKVQPPEAIEQRRFLHCGAFDGEEAALGDDAAGGGEAAGFAAGRNDAVAGNDNGAGIAAHGLADATRIRFAKPGRDGAIGQGFAGPDGPRCCVDAAVEFRHASQIERDVCQIAGFAGDQRYNSADCLRHLVGRRSLPGGGVAPV
jgi:uncharacterized membrane protein YoaK (UPF0700 family)